MSVFVELTIDDFQKTFTDSVTKGKSARIKGDNPNVRRPMRGLEIKDDTYAIIRVIRADGSQVPLFDSGAADGSGQSADYANFMLQSVSEARMEKQQIVETFGEPYIFFFGEAPRFIDVQAILLKSFDFNWRAEWWENYDKYLRGTRLVELGARAYLFYEDTIIEGYILNAQAQESSDMPLFLQLQFRMFVTNYANVSFIGDPFYPIRSGAIPPPGVADLTDMNAWGQLALKSPDQTSPEQQAQEAFLQALRAGGARQLEAEVLRAKNLNSVLSQQQQIAAQQALFSSGNFFNSAYLTSVLRYGMTSSSFPAQDIEGFLFNVNQFLVDASQSIHGGPRPPPELDHRTPIRSKISDNFDEYTQGALKYGFPGNAPPKNNPSLQKAPGVGAPVAAPANNPIGLLYTQACLRGASIPANNLYGFGLVPYSPGLSLQQTGPFGRPLGAGAGFTGGATVGGAFVGAAGGAGGFGVGGTVGTPFASGAGAAAVAGAYAGQTPFATQTGFGGAPPSIAGLILANQGLSQAGNAFPGTGFGYRSAFSRSYGYTAGVGGAFGGSMGGAFGPGIGGGLGGYGSKSFGNPAFQQFGNPLTQQFALSQLGLPTGSPYGIGYGAPNSPSTASVYRYTAGIRPDGTLQSTQSVTVVGVPGAGNFGGFGAVAGAPTMMFGGTANVAAVSALGPGVIGDGVFGMQALPGTFDPTLQGAGRVC